MSSEIVGLVAAPLTPMKPNGAIDYTALGPIAAGLIADGVVGVYVNGTTGEGVSLTSRERLDLAEEWMQLSQNQLRVIINVSDLCLEQSRRYAKHAQKIGAQGIGTVGPFFYKLATLYPLIDFCRATAAAAPDLPFYFYHIPAMTGLDFKAVQFIAQACIEIPTFRGIKFTHEDLMDFAKAVAMDGGRYEMLFGRDESLLAGLALGAKGAIGSTYNFAAPIYRRMMRSFAAGDLAAAQSDQLVAVELVQRMLRFGAIPSQKAIMGMIGRPCGVSRCPLLTLTVPQTEALRKELDRFGFFERLAECRAELAQPDARAGARKSRRR